MKIPFALALSVLIGGAAAATAQIPDFSPNAAAAPNGAVPVETVVMPSGTYFPVEQSSSRGGFSVSVEPMAWWLKPAPLSVPTLTTYFPNTPSEAAGNGGALGYRGTVVLSPDQFSYGAAFAGRGTIGVSVNEFFGLEFGGFLTETKASQFMTTSPGSPPLRIPFINQSAITGFPLGESSFVLSDIFPPDIITATGSQAITSASQLWGLEGNAVSLRTSVMNTNLSFLAGFRYVDLKEDLNIYNVENVIGHGTFVGTDAFATRNQFFGGQIGVRAETSYSLLFLSAEAKLALGWNHESVSINGFSTSTAPGTPQFGPGAIFSQASNIGRQTNDVITVVPQLQVKTGANITSRIRAFVGYDLLFLSDVVRPGNQLDRVINFQPNAVVNEKVINTVDAPNRPVNLFNHTDFWAQGVSVGFEFRY